MNDYEKALQAFYASGVAGNAESFRAGWKAAHLAPDDDRIKEAFMNMLNQACGFYDGDQLFFDSMCMSSYEEALDLAEELDWITPEQYVR